MREVALLEIRHLDLAEDQPLGGKGIFDVSDLRRTDDGCGDPGAVQQPRQPHLSGWGFPFRSDLRDAIGQVVVLRSVVEALGVGIGPGPG